MKNIVWTDVDQCVCPHATAQWDVFRETTYSMWSSASSAPSLREREDQAKCTTCCIPCHIGFFQVLKSLLSPCDRGLEGLRLFILKRRQIGSLMINADELMNERDKVHLVLPSSLPRNASSPL